MSTYKNGTYKYPQKNMVKRTGTPDYPKDRVFGAYRAPDYPPYSDEELESVRNRLPSNWENFPQKNKNRIVNRLLNDPSAVY